MQTAQDRIELPVEVAAIWLLFAVVGLEILVTYSRLPATELYHVSDLGFALDGVPLLGRIFETGALRSQPHVAGLHAAVHHGHHHGMDGTLLVLTALLLPRALPGIRRASVRALLRAYLSLMLCYGVG